jgi:hypothetical protein
MPCVRHLIRDPGDTFDLQIASANNLFACLGRLRITGPATGTSRDFSCDELHGGIGIPLEAGMSYTLRVVVQPQGAGVVSITARTSAGMEACSRDGAGEIGTWTIDVL